MTPEQAENVRMLRDSAAAVVPVGGSLSRVHALRLTLPGIDRGTWREMAGMGWLGLLAPEGAGGAGLYQVSESATPEGGFPRRARSDSR